MKISFFFLLKKTKQNSILTVQLLYLSGITPCFFDDLLGYGELGLYEEPDFLPRFLKF